MRLWQHLLKQQAPPASAAYRYWRIFIQTNNWDSNFTSLCEIELRLSVGGGDLTSTGTPVIASSGYSGFPPDFTVDNGLTDINSWVSSQGYITNQWLRYDMGVPVLVAQVALYPQPGAGSRAPRDFIIQGSNDGTNFTDVKAFTGITGWINAWRTFDL